MTKIIVDQDRCTQCGICTEVCPSGFIFGAKENKLPQALEKVAFFCANCGHCETSCPVGALTLNYQLGEKRDNAVEPDGISPDSLGMYLKKRRSIRHFTTDPVPKEKILEVLDIARYAPSGGNGQPVQWLIVHNTEKVNKIAGLTIEWMKSLLNTAHPMSGYVPMIISAWEQGYDVICRDAPHLLFAHIPEENQIAPIDAIIALAYVDITMPAFGIGTCWAGFVAMAATSYEPLQKELGLPAGRKCAYAMMFGYPQPQFKIHRLPRRNTLQVAWL